MFGILKVVEGLDKGRTFTLVDGQTIALGRAAETHTKLTDPYVALVHCHVKAQSGKVIVTDAQTGAETFVNKESITEHELQNGDELQVGGTVLSFQWTHVDEGVTRQRARPDFPE